MLDPHEPGLSFEGLIDALMCLYEHCSSNQLKEFTYLMLLFKLIVFTEKNLNFDFTEFRGGGEFVHLQKIKSSHKIFTRM